MSYIQNFRFSASALSNCEYILLEDKSTYPVTMPGAWGAITRANMGIAIFWSADDFVTVAGMDLSNSEDGIWSLPNPTNNTYTIRIYAVPIWTAGTWTLNQMCWHEGTFYICTTSPTTQVPGSYDIPSSDWDVLDALSDHATFNTHLYTGSTIKYGYQEVTCEVECQPYSIEKIDDGKYTLLCMSSATARTVAITKWNGDALDPAISLTIEALETSLSIDLTDYGSGVYHVTISEVPPSDYVVAKLVIYELSDIIDYAKEVLQTVLQESYDPSVETTDQITLNTMRTNRDKLNKFFFMFSFIMAYVNVENTKYLHIFDIDETRQNYINKIGDYVDKLLYLIEE